MTVLRGLVIDGDVIPGTDWVLRDPRAWFTPGARGTRPRAAFIDVLVGHATGGEAGVGSIQDDGPFVFDVLRSRVTASGRPLQCGIHFVIGACAREDAEALVWQTADPGMTATTHVGLGSVNRRSIGVETVSALFPGPLDRRQRPQVSVPLLGRIQRVLSFFPGQLRAWRRLAETLADLNGRGGISIPRQIPRELGARRLTRDGIAAFRGAVEHLHMPGTKKLDAGGLLVAELAAAGWKPA